MSGSSNFAQNDIPGCHFYKITLAYDGTNYHGWQRQKEHKSIDSVVRETFLRSFHQKDLFLVGASRTDAGVHARGQVIRIGTHLALCPQKLLFVMNRALPADIQVVSCRKVVRRFHPQHNVIRKIYSYSLSLSKISPMESRYFWHFCHPLDQKTLSEALQLFVGTHDFKDFAKEQETKRSTIRTVESVRIEPSECGQKIILFITGPSFLRYMIRRMVGAACIVASRPELSLNDLKNKLTGTSSSIKLLITAPAHGLCLESIEYQE